MIASVKGVVTAVTTDHVVISVGGIGFQVFVSTPTLSTIGEVGASAFLFTQMVVREDSLTLFGFRTEEELKFFQLLQNVSGIGPKLALTMLSAMSAGELAAAIAGESLELITTIPGVGKKLAGRLILELKDKVVANIPGGVASVGEGDSDIVAALLSLGYSAAETSRAVASLPRDPNLSIEDKVRLALNYFEKS